MDNFDLKKYLAEGRLFEEEKKYTLFTTNVEYDNGKTGYMYQLVDSEDGEENEIGFDQLYFVGKGDASDPRVFTGKDFKEFDQGSYQEEEVSAEEAMKIYKSLAEGKLYEAINLDIEDDIAILSGDSGEYEGEIEDGKTSFSIIYDDLDYRISDQYNENNIEDFLGKGHAFVELAKKYDHKWGIERDLVGITIKLK
jgi:hypothetical protein